MGAILLMRHADAVDETLTIRESHRYLTREGRKQAVAVGRRMRDQQLAIDAVVSSPLMRAAQTAELVVAALGFAGAVEALPGLAPGGDAHAVADELARWPGCILAVGHEPGLSAVGTLLCRRSAFPPLHKAQVYLVRDEHPVWSLRPGDAAPVLLD
ncbi:MAG TPA: histidine phosphatase family protein [Kofleriaceae bacterium]|nr:histidine phosphatase family protein [Kofleriaceae bacterium]